MTNHDFKAAHRYLERSALGETLLEENPDIWAAALLALRLADRLMQEPSDSVREAIAEEAGLWDDQLAQDNVYEAMRDQLIKEIEGE